LCRKRGTLGSGCELGKQGIKFSGKKKGMRKKERKRKILIPFPIIFEGSFRAAENPL
jgi:hypothetical protein